jgi:MYXO-CTERM domain-containing protein
VIYLGPGVGLAIVGFLTFWLRRRRGSDDASQK